MYLVLSGLTLTIPIKVSMIYNYDKKTQKNMPKLRAKMVLVFDARNRALFALQFSVRAKQKISKGNRKWK
jgi:hypothetical protein